MWGRFAFRVFRFRYWIPLSIRPTKIAAIIGAAGIASQTVNSSLGNAQATQSSQQPVIPIHYEVNKELQVQSDHKLTKRELRFLKFASVEYDDVIYMTPMDFLDSLTFDAPRERVYRRMLKQKNVKAMLEHTPPLRKEDKNFMRNLGENGIISYAEYMFLLTLLTKSKHGFEIAFTMFDKDNNGRIEKHEFLLVCALVSALRSTRRSDVESEHCDLDIPELEYLIKQFGLHIHPNQSAPFEKSDEEVSAQVTTIQLHLFGRSGAETLSLSQLQMFYNSLQKEVVEMEFNEFSRGKSEISPVDFARLLLRYSVVRHEDYARYIRRMKERSLPDDKGITLEQFETLSLFLNNLDDFTAAVRLYTASDISVSQNEFIRAVRAATSLDLDEYVVELIYRIFDANQDNRLSYSEFIGIMNDRLHRGLKIRNLRSFGWQTFRRCVMSKLGRY